MSCYSGAVGSFPDPNHRTTNGRAYQYNNPRGGGGGGSSGSSGPNTRRTTFHSRRIYRASELLQSPTSITLRELALVLFALFFLYRGFFTARDLRDLVFRRRVSEICPVTADGAACLMRYLRAVWFIHLWRLAADVVPWGVVGAATAFAGELAISAVRG